MHFTMLIQAFILKSTTESGRDDSEFNDSEFNKKEGSYMKKFLALMLVAIMACSMFATASASSLAGTYDITVWVAEKAVELTKTQIEAFNTSNELGIVFNATVEAVSEADAATQMITDVEAGGDLFCFAQDQFARLVQAGALAKLGVKAGETVAAANDPSVVAAATVGDTLYAYPLTADNGYFMYYDKTVIPEEHIHRYLKIIGDIYESFQAQKSCCGFHVADVTIGSVDLLRHVCLGKVPLFSQSLNPLPND